jgi:hypothetical protein
MHNKYMKFCKATFVFVDYCRIMRKHIKYFFKILLTMHNPPIGDINFDLSKEIYHVVII